MHIFISYLLASITIIMIIIEIISFTVYHDINASIQSSPCCTQAEAAEVQVDVIEEGAEELDRLERFVRATEPPPVQAAALAVRAYEPRHLLICTP